MNKIILGKDADGNVTILNQVPLGIVDASGNPLDPAYRITTKTQADLDKAVIDAQAVLDAVQTEQSQASQAPLPPVKVPAI